MVFAAKLGASVLLFVILPLTTGRILDLGHEWAMYRSHIDQIRIAAATFPGPRSLWRCNYNPQPNQRYANLFH